MGTLVASLEYYRDCLGIEFIKRTIYWVYKVLGLGSLLGVPPKAP